MNDKDFAKRVYDLFISLMRQKAFGSLVIDIGELNDVMMEANERSKSDRVNAIPKSEIVELKGVSQ
jgi:hypothetical protein